MIVGQNYPNVSLHGANVHFASLIARASGLAVFLLILAVSPALAQSNVQPNCPILDLDGPVAGDELSAFVAALEATDGERLPSELARPDAPGFSEHVGRFPDFGYTKSKIWFRLCLRNRTDTNDWRLYIHENFFQEFSVFLIGVDGQVNTIVTMTPDSPFSDRIIAYPELVVPMTLPRDTVVTLLVKYRSGGASQMDFSVETAESFTISSTARTAKNFIFYGMMFFLISLSVGSLLVLRQVVFLAYACYATSILLFLMHGDGAAFQYLWPTLPGLNGNASILTGGALIVFGSIYAQVFLRTKTRHPNVDKVLWAIVVLTPMLIAALFVPNPQLLKKLLVMLSLLSILVFTGGGLISYFSGHRDVRFYTLAWVGALFSSGLMNLRHVVGVEIPQETVHDSIRVVMVLDATMMGLAIADRYNQLRRGRQAALEDNLVATRQRLDLNRRLTDLQARHDLAVELAKSRDRHIQNVVHDLRQPLHALRLNVATLTSDPPSSGQNDPPQNVEAAFSYLETLIAEHLETPTASSQFQPAETPPRAAAPDQETTDTNPDLRAILTAVSEMFQPDAEAKDLSLRLVPSQINLPIDDALAVTRILSNLVSNAIKYTATGGVLIGTRRRGATVRVEIHDTGPGMSSDDFARASGRSIRLEPARHTTDGKGLGLSIAIDLAQRHGMRLEHIKGRHKGAGLALIIPA